MSREANRFVFCLSPYIFMLICYFYLDTISVVLLFFSMLSMLSSHNCHHHWRYRESKRERETDWSYCVFCYMHARSHTSLVVVMPLRLPWRTDRNDDRKIVAATCVLDVHVLAAHHQLFPSYFKRAIRLE
jgi:hypothetical protein